MRFGCPCGLPAALPPWTPDQYAYNASLTRLRVDEDADELCLQGNYHAEKGKMDKALACFEKAAEIAPGMANAHCLRGCALVALGRHKGAAASFRTAIDLDHDNALAHAGIGWALVELKRPAEARKYLKKAVRLDPFDPVACTQMGMAFLEMGRPEKSHKWFDRSIDIEPTAEGYGGKARALALLEFHDAAAEMLGRAARV